MAKSADNVVYDHLAKHGLSGEKWSMPFFNLGITNPDKIEDKENKFATLSVFATPSEKIALRKALGISDPLSALEGVHGILKEADLEVEYWEKVLSKQVGAITANGVHNMSGIFYPHLVKFARSKEEQKAVQVILRMKVDKAGLSEHYDKYVSGLEERATQMLHAMKKVQDAQSDGRVFEDQAVQNLCKCFQEHLQVPKEFWFSIDTFDMIITSFKAYHELMCEVVKTEMIEDSTVVQKASNGLALKGVLIKGNDKVRKQNIVLDVPEGIELQLPFHSQSVKTIRCIGKEEEEVILKGTKAPKERTHPVDYCSTVKFFNAPVASCIFDCQQLKLSDEAIGRLKAIENSSENAILGNCESFMNDFGSHVCLGPFHFGGTYKWHCYSCSVSQDDILTAQSLQTEVIKVHGCMSNPPKNPEVNENNFQCSSDLNQRTYIDITTSGGAKTPVSVGHWKLGLMVDKSSWVLLSTGDEHFPIWEIILKFHDKDFKKASLLADNLKQAWQKQNLVYLRIEDFPSSDIHEELKSEVAVWMNESDLSNCVKHLSHLLEVKELVTKMDIQIWAKYYLSLIPVQKYLEVTVNRCREQSTEVCEEIRSLLRQVVGPADLESVPKFPNRNLFQSWVFETKTPHALIDLNDLMLSVENCLKFASEIVSDNPQNNETLIDSLSDPDTALRATTVVRNTLYHLRKHFEKTGQSYDDLYITTLLVPFQCGVHHMVYLRGPYNIDLLKALFQKHTRSFFEVKRQNSALKLQAFLVLLAIEVSNDIDMCATSRLYDHLTRMSEVIGKHIDSAVKNVVQSLMCGDVTIQWANTTLTRIMKASMEDGMSEEVELAIKNAAEPLKQKDPAKSFELMLSVFDLKKYYPQKLTLLQALEVKQDNFEGSQVCFDRKVYPFMILKKILSFDKCFVELTNLVINDMGWMSQQLKTAEFVEVKEEKLEASINPLDGLITVLACSDNFLRQDLMCRLATCQIAIPLVLPDHKRGNLTLALWSMRTIIKEWELQSVTDSEVSGFEVPIILHPTPIISFMRFGIHKNSKSKIINMTMDCSHDTFFHYDCKGGRTPKLLAEGMIDIAWHLPSTNSSFPDALTFLNLHGDARNFKSQVQFISGVCLMHFVLLDVKELNESGHEVLEVLSKAPGGVVLLQSGRVSRVKHYLKSERINKIGCIELDNRNEAEKRTDIQNMINACITKSWDRKTPQMERYRKAALRCGIVVDEDDEECGKGKSLALDFKLVLDRLGKGVNPKCLLHLQGVDYWHEIAKKEKEKHRQLKNKQMTATQYTEFIEKDIASLYRKQHGCVKKIGDNPLVNSFLTTLCNLSRDKVARNYYLRWLKIILDDLSREKLPPLHKEYHKKRAEYHYLKKKGEDIHKCKEDMEQLNMKLISASFGLEHLLREIGQMYQASVMCDHKKYKHLPEIVAELLIEGYPLELMDGDTAHVPLKWVLAVLDHVKTKLNDPQILVISIVGIQSSGKSTLLNTLFGVNFSVSAGRCTRGAYMQLLPFHHRSFKKNSYLLLVDTEGLRAPELDATQTHNHDNQLGTFVIGLAQLTLINIFGEVLADMNDILQTAVHAFLRMKHVTTLSPGCHFVHQNVSGLMTSNKGMIGRAKITDNLDEMTQIAAKKESLEKKYTSFNDVIQFDDDRDVSYFPSLWYGNPPMAPVNPEYSKKARLLKNHLIQCASGCCMVSFTEFTSYLEKFWNAILQENFIFSFKNTLEMSVFSDLDAERSKWFWSFRKEMLQSEDDFETEIHNCTEANDLATEVYERAQLKVFQTLSTTYAEILCKIEKYFKEHIHREILINWKHETERLLNNLNEELKEQAEKHCKQVWHSKKAKAKVNEIKSKCQTVISERVRNLVADLDREERLSPLQLQIKFEEQWSEWISNLVALSKASHIKHNIDLQVQEALIDHFKQSKAFLNKMIPAEGGKSLERWGEKLVLIVEEEPHIIKPSASSFSERFAGKIGRFVGWKSLQPTWMQIAEQETSRYLQEVEKYLISKQRKDYNPSYATEILTLLDEKLRDFNRDEIFKFSPEYKMDLALTACGYALKKFKEMAERYRDENDPVKCLGREKERYFQDFCDKYSSIAEEAIAARQCCELLETTIQHRIIKSLSVTVVEKMEGDDTISFLFTKPSLIRHVLVQIGTALQQNDFNSCYRYLKHPSEYLEEYVKSFTEIYCDGHQGQCSNLTMYARELLDGIMTFIWEVINAVNKSNQQSLSTWINEFKSRLSQRLIIEDDIRCTLSSGGDNKHFNAELKKRLDKLKEKLSRRLVLSARDMESWDKRPYDLIFKRVRGCKAACPFCREPCNNSNNHHDGDHSVKLHRPKCLGGWRIRSTGKMTLETCTEAIANDSYFYKPNSDDTHPYRECETVFPKWCIQRDLPGETSLYWKYVVAHFKSELATLYDMKEESVPEHWMKFELTQAIEAL
ncbi:Interferon-induced very large GTPase 1 [Geodia barretti]|uniref:Interferon-induced very large GTPase 1 n=1 Tax=Geodia barretti TaxID=519541 RepID=A0AA35RHQ6_GEOBA|nr:Interferon-induced very large GTPase 1 [Geodia barretti]